MPTTSISRCGGSSTPAFVTAVEATNPDALWPLTETSGTIAYDALSGHHDAPANLSAATWATYTNPLGTPSPHFGVTQGYRTATLDYSPNLAGDFTAAIWVYRTADLVDECMGQDVVEVNRIGWNILLHSASSVNPDVITLEIGTGVGAFYLPADSVIALNTWYWAVATHASGTWRLYVNGAVQSTTYSGAYSNASDRRIWIGYSGTSYGLVPDCGLGYATLWATRALSGAEIAGIYATVPP